MPAVVFRWLRSYENDVVEAKVIRALRRLAGQPTSEYERFCGARSRRDPEIESQAMQDGLTTEHQQVSLTDLAVDSASQRQR